MSDLMIPQPGAVTAERRQRSGFPDLAPHIEADRIVRENRDAITKALVSRFDGSDLGLSRYRKARRQLELIPSVGTLTRVAEDLGVAMDAPPDRKVTQLAVAVLFDSRVRGPQNPEVYLKALVYDLCDEGFPPAVVVAACQQLRRESKFTPEIAEVITACREKASSYRAMARMATRLCENRVALEDQIRAAEEPQRRQQPTFVEPFDRDSGEVD